jgi:hypothetical protein
LSPQPFAPIHPLIYTLFDETTFLSYWNALTYKAALAEYTNLGYGEATSKKLVTFLTLDYTFDGHKYHIHDEKYVTGAIAKFSGLLMSRTGEPIQQEVSITASTAEQPCDAVAYKDFVTKLDNLLEDFDGLYDVNDVIVNKFAVDSQFYNTAWINCGVQMDMLLNATVGLGVYTSMDCVNDDPASDSYQNDSCCSARPAWSSICRPREVEGETVSYSLDTNKLESCGSMKCSQSFLEDYLDSPPQSCEDISTALSHYKLDKRK